MIRFWFAFRLTMLMTMIIMFKFLLRPITIIKSYLVKLLLSLHQTIPCSFTPDGYQHHLFDIQFNFPTAAVPNQHPLKLLLNYIFINIIICCRMMYSFNK